MGNITAEEIIDALKTGDSFVIFGENNSGKTSLLLQIERTFAKNNGALFYENKNKKILPCIYIPAKRIFHSTNEGINENSETLTFETFSTINVRWNDAPYIQGIKKKVLSDNILKSKIETICKSVLNVDNLNITDNNNSDGVQNLINIFAFIFFSLALYYGSNDIHSLLKKKFVLLIDEIELFLYAKSLTLMIIKLIDTFKKGSFVFSTHSPLVLQRLKDFTVLKIKSLNEISDYDKSPYYDELGNLLEAYFEINNHPKELDNFVSKLDKLIEDKQSDENILFNIFKEADDLRKKYPSFSFLINCYQMDFYKKIKHICSTNKED